MTIATDFVSVEPLLLLADGIYLGKMTGYVVTLHNYPIHFKCTQGLRGTSYVVINKRGLTIGVTILK